MSVAGWSQWLAERLWPRVEPWFLRQGYDPARYWNARGRIFFLEGYQRGLYWQHEWLVHYLQTIPWSTLLEVGCGFGRNLRHLRQFFPSPTHRLYGTDISAPLLDQARRLLSKDNVMLLQGDARRLPAFPEPLDVIISHGLLMHLPRPDAETAAAQIAKNARTAIVCAEQIIPSRGTSTETVPINRFTFAHPVASLFASLGWRLTQQEERGALGIYAFARP